MARRIVEQSLIYISAIGGQPIENFKNPIVYNSQPVITVSGGSGTGSLHFSVQPVDGACTVTSAGKIAFKHQGKSWITIYKDGSDFSKTEQGQTILCTYQRSKLLIVEIEWKERQIIIKVANNQYIKVGDKIPAVNQNNYIVTGLIAGDSLKQNPELFFVYESDDFYKFDVFTQTYSDDRYDNGIRYIKNDDGSWTVSGRATALSYYNLIISNTMLPDFFKPGRTFKLTIKEKEGDYYKTITNSPVRVYIGWYTADGKYTYNTYSSAATIEVPKEVQYGELIKGKAVGVVMKLRVENGTNLGSGRTFLFNMRYVDDRSIDNLHEGKYPIGARYAQAPNKVGYDQEIQYRSNRGQFRGLVIQNNKKYNLYLDYDANLGKVSADRYSGYPYTEITFFVESNIDTTYESLEDTKYIIGVDPNQTIFDDFLYEKGTVVIRGNSNFHIESKYNNEYDYVPFQIIREEKSNFNGLNSGEYKFRIPLNNSTLYCNFHTLNFDPDDPESPYHPEWITGDPPYVDIYGPRKQTTHYQVEDKYWQGVVFCYFARQQYFGEDIPLMQGTSDTTFYNVNKFNGETEYYLLRKDLITVVNRISHALRGVWPDIDDVRKNPDEAFYDHAESMNAPQARLFTYAGYPKSPKYQQKWHWVEKEVQVQEEIKYSMVSAETGANIRSAPSTSATRVGHYAQGTIVQFLSVDANGWAKIYKLGSTSEVVYTSNKSLTPISTYTDVTLYKTTQPDMNIRTGPGTGYSVLDRLPQGSTVLVTTITSGWAKLNAAYKNGTRLDYSKQDGYISSQYLQKTTDQEGITKKVKEQVYDVDIFGSPVYSTDYDLDADGNIQYEDIQYTRYTGKFPSKPPEGTERTIDWLLMSFDSENNNPYGANDDYLINYGSMPNIAWGSYTGVMNGYSEQEFGASCYATYQEAVTVLWRYARFRQFDIMGDGGYYMEIDDSDVAYWAQHGPWRWAISRGIFDGYRMQYKIGGGSWSPRTKAKPTDYINRAEWAYMVYKFCTMYAW